MKFLEFSNSKLQDPEEFGTALKEHIDSFTSLEELRIWYNHFIDNYDLPYDIINQTLKLKLAEQFDAANTGKFFGLHPSGVYISIIKLFFIIIYAIALSKKNNSIKRFKLIINGIASDGEYIRFGKLIKLFDKLKHLT